MFEKLKTKIKSAFSKKEKKSSQENSNVDKKEEITPERSNLEKEGEKRSLDTVKVHPGNQPETPWVVDDMSKTQIRAQAEESKMNTK